MTIKANVRSPLDLDAETFNRTAEEHYRTTLRNRHVREAFQFLREDAATLDSLAEGAGWEMRQALHAIQKGCPVLDFLSSVEREVIEERASRETLERVICLMLVNIHREMNRNLQNRPPLEPLHAAPVY